METLENFMESTQNFI